MSAPVADMSPVAGGGSLMLAWRVAGRRVVVVGGGGVAAGRVRLALDADAAVTVVAPELNPELRARHARGAFTWVPRRWVPGDEDGAVMVMCAVDEPSVGDALAARCRAAGIPINVADVIPSCDFWFPSVHREGPVQIAVSTNGTGPALSRRIRQRIAAALPDEVGRAATAFGKLRQAIRAATPDDAASSRRMGWLTQLAEVSGWSRLAELTDADVDALVARYQSGRPPVDAASPPTPGRIRLVGAGPGDPELLTVRAVRALAEADLVLADRLVPDAILALVQGELRIARKRRGRADEAQQALDDAVVQAARQGRDVVRLKCGDPFVFGRGGEEIETYAAAGLTAEVVPGLTSALTAPLGAGIPATQRGLADRVLIATAAGQGGSLPPVPRFAADTTVVLLMGVGRLRTLPEELGAAGWPEDWPAAIVERGSHPDARTTHTTVGQLAAVAVARQIRPPAVIVLGRVAAVAERLRLSSVPASAVA